MAVPEQGDFVLDASSLLAYLRGEPGGDLVQRVFSHCAECGYKAKTTALVLLRVYEQAAEENELMMDDVISVLEQLPLEVVPLTGDLAAQSVRTSLVKGIKDSAGGSAAELATVIGGTLVTADKDMARLLPGSLLVSERTGRKDY